MVGRMFVRFLQASAVLSLAAGVFAAYEAMPMSESAAKEAWRECASSNAIRRSEAIELRGVSGLNIDLPDCDEIQAPQGLARDLHYRIAERNFASGLALGVVCFFMAEVLRRLGDKGD